MKKNTLLYLDAEIVAKAKQHHLNLSKITEDAVRSHLFPMLSRAEKAEIDFWGYLKQLEKEMDAFFLPTRIKRIKLAHIGPFDSITIYFKKFNLINGKGAAGKTTLIRSIAYIFGHEFSKEYFSNKGTIELDVYPEKYKISLLSNEKDRIRCLLVDRGGARLDDNGFKKFLAYLKKLNIQIIMTERGLIEKISYRNINVIELPNPRD